jgi:hypothetical protein
MSPSKSVIDLVSSDDEEVVRTRPLAKIAARKRDPSSEDLVGHRPVKQAKNKLKNPYQKPIPTMGQTLDTSRRSQSIPSTVAVTSLTPVVFDDAGNDNAIITFGALELLSELTRKDSLLCSGRSLQQGGQGGPKSTVCHIKQNDRWSCGFRNLQMLLTAMIPHMPASHSFFHTIPRRDPNPAIPSLRQLQSALESSWKAGFDPAGARHFKHKVVGRASEIGAVEVSSVLAYCGVDSTVVQFIKCRESREMLPKFIRAYFSKSVGIDGCPFCATSHLGSDSCAKELLQLAGSGIHFEPTCNCPLFPLYLQWEGHSVSIVGIGTDDGILVLDPLKDGTQMKSDLQKGKVPQYLRISSKSLANKDTQLVMSSFRCLTNREKENRMEEPSAVTAAVEAVERVLMLENQRRR